MRWENLRLTEEGGPAPPLIERRAVARTFDTPEFRGITFYEIQARSIINRVPDASRVPFRWTINPYRGCSHACSYCMVGETPILMADGRTKPLAELRVGDAIFGTIRQGNHRRYTVTRVFAHWSTVKPAYRIALRDGTRLVASGDHRFLSNRGWKHVTGGGQGHLRRPHLTLANSLIGTGGFAEPPKDDPEYRRGYLAGIVRGDGNTGPTADREHMQRADRYRAEFGDVDGVPDSQVGWPEAPSVSWRKGLLAGTFDAEGSYQGGILRISNADPQIIDTVVTSLRTFGFSAAIERSAGRRICAVRVRGGLREHLRFFHSVDPAVSRERNISGQPIKFDAQLNVVSVENLGLDLPMYDITTGTGDFIADGVVSHNCFARNTHTYLDLDAGHDFDSKIVVKTNAPRLLRKELASPRWQGEHIAMGTNVDCYQRGEGRYRLMPGIIEALRDHANPFSILTKGSLILRDLELLRQAAQVTEVGFNVSVGITDHDLWRSLESGTPPPRRRLDVCRRLNEAGLPCGVLMAPVLPFLSDAPEQLESTVRQIAEAGAIHVSPIVLHLRPGAREWFYAWLERYHADLVPRYRHLYGRGSYAPKAYQQQISGQVQQLARRYGIGRSEPSDTRRIGPSAKASARTPVAGSTQLTLM